MISAVVLAAGKSTRMGFCKQLLKIGDRRMIEQVVGNVCTSRVDESIVVLGFMADEIAEKLPKEQVKIVVNPSYEKGMSTSLKAGLNAVDGETDAVIFVLSDQPFVKPFIINKLIDDYERTGAPIVVPTYKGKRGNPVLFDMSLRDELMDIQGDVGGRSIIKKYRKEVRKIEVDSPFILMGIDTKEDLEVLERGDLDDQNP